MCYPSFADKEIEVQTVDQLDPAQILLSLSVFCHGCFSSDFFEIFKSLICTPQVLLKIWLSLWNNLCPRIFSGV